MEGFVPHIPCGTRHVLHGVSKTVHDAHPPISDVVIYSSPVVQSFQITGALREYCRKACRSKQCLLV